MSYKSGLFRQLGFLLGFSVLSFYPAIALYVDIVVLDNRVQEQSVTEFSQALCLLIAFLIFLRESLKAPQNSGFYSLAAGFFLVMLIRENDVYLDNITHGFWVYPALLVTAFACYKAYLARGGIMAQMSDFLRSGCGIYVSLGIITVLFFSRSIGTSKLWEPVMGEVYSYTLKTAIQEGTELYGYLIVFAGALIMAFRSPLQPSS